MRVGTLHKRALWKVSIVATAETEDAITEILRAKFGKSAYAYTDAESGTTRVSVFLGSQPPSALMRRSLLAALQHLQNCGLRAGTAKISVVPVRRENWAESWRRHFRPIEVSPRLLIKPSWSRRLGHKGQSVVVLDPGLSFGTGQHPTTAFCLQQLVARRHPEEPQSFLDLGTGSGILAITAAKLGYQPIEALDFDAEAISIARQNARANRVARQIRLFRCNIQTLPLRSAAHFSIICANLVSSLLIEQKQKIINRLTTNGVVVLAGVLRKEFATVRREYETSGLRLVDCHAEGEWRSGAFRVRTDSLSAQDPTAGTFF